MLKSADGIATQMETAVVDDASQFTPLFDRPTVLQEGVKRDCTTKVDEPFSAGVYSLAKANAGYTACGFVELCDKKKVERDLIDGTTLIHEAASVATREE